MYDPAVNGLTPEPRFQVIRALSVLKLPLSTLVRAHAAYYN